MAKIEDMSEYFEIFEDAVQKFLNRVLEDQPKEVSKLMNSMTTRFGFIPCCMRTECPYCGRHHY